MRERDAPASLLLSLAVTFVALVAGATVAQVAFGLCNELVNPGGLEADVCEISDGGGRLLALLLPPGAVLLVGLGTRRRLPLLMTFGVVLLASILAFLGLAILAS